MRNTCLILGPFIRVHPWTSDHNDISTFLNSFCGSMLFLLHGICSHTAYVTSRIDISNRPFWEHNFLSINPSFPMRIFSRTFLVIFCRNDPTVLHFSMCSYVFPSIFYELNFKLASHLLDVPSLLLLKFINWIEYFFSLSRNGYSKLFFYGSTIIFPVNCTQKY